MNIFILPFGPMDVLANLGRPRPRTCTVQQRAAERSIQIKRWSTMTGRVGGCLDAVDDVITTRDRSTADFVTQCIMVTRQVIRSSNMIPRLPNCQ